MGDTWGERGRRRQLTLPKTSSWAHDKKSRPLPKQGAARPQPIGGRGLGHSTLMVITTASTDRFEVRVQAALAIRNVKAELTA